jgi:hypothetical protein
MTFLPVVLAVLSLGNVPSCSAQEVDAREIYRIIDTYGRTIRATTFSDPTRLAHTLEDRECYIGVYDRDQKFRKDARGLLTGDNLMCQVLRRRQGVQISFIDGGCLGKQVLPEGAPESQFRPTLNDCGRSLLELLMSDGWREYVTVKGMSKKGWDRKKTEYVDMQVDPGSGKTKTRPGQRPGGLAEVRARLFDLGGAYDRSFGRPALEGFATKTLWAYVLGNKTDALEVFQKAPWWGRAQSPAQPQAQTQTQAPVQAPAQPAPAGDVVPLLR